MVKSRLGEGVIPDNEIFGCLNVRYIEPASSFVFGCTFIWDNQSNRWKRLATNEQIPKDTTYLGFGLAIGIGGAADVALIIRGGSEQHWTIEFAHSSLLNKFPRLNLHPDRIVVPYHDQGQPHVQLI